jgi:ubiquinone/menaquinone biosynthesis C-methylase UbiE
MLVPEPRKALAEAYRVLTPGGRLAAIVFSTPENCPYISIPHAVARRVGRLTFRPDEFGEFRLSRPGVLEAAYRAVGFRDVAVHAVPTRYRFPSAAEAVEYARALPVQELMAQLNEIEREHAWAEIEQELRQFEGPDGYDSPCELLIGVGTK